jgi:general stress protein CsbA
MGVSIDPQPLSELSRAVSRWVWIPFVVNAVTGTLLFASKAPEYTANTAFVIKMALISIGLIYHSIVFRTASRWDNLLAMPVGAKLLGGISLSIWIGVITSSRWIAYVH